MSANGELPLSFDTRSLFRIGVVAFIAGDALGTTWVLTVNRLLDLRWYELETEALPMFFNVGLLFGAVTCAVTLALVFLRQPRPAKVAWDGARITMFDGDTPRTSIAWTEASLGTMSTYIKHSKHSETLSYVGSAIQLKGAQGQVIELSEGTQPFYLNGHKTSTPLQSLLPMISQLPRHEMVLQSFNTTALSWVVAIGAYACTGLGLGALTQSHGNDLPGVQLLIAGAALFLLRTLYTAGLLRRARPDDPLRKRALWIEIGVRALIAPLLALPALLWFSGVSAPPEWRQLHDDESSMTLSPDGRVAAFTQPAEIHLEEVITNEKQSRRLDADYSIDHIAITTDGNKVAFSGRGSTIAIWSPGGDRMINTAAHDHLVTAIAISPNGERVVSGSQDNTARIWSGETGELIATLSHAATVHAAAISDRLVLTGCDDKSATLWDHSGAKQVSLEPASAWLSAVAFSDDGTRAATGDSDGVVRIFDTANGMKLREIRSHQERIMALAFSHDGTKLASASLDQSIRIHGEEEVKIDLRRNEYFRETRERGRSLAFSEGDRALFIATENAGILAVP